MQEDGSSDKGPHTCQHCENLILDAVALKTKKRPFVVIPFELAALKKGAQFGCPFLQGYEPLSNDSGSETENEETGEFLRVSFSHRRDPADIDGITTSNPSRNWEVCAHPNDPSARWVKSREPCRNFNHDTAFRCARNWISQCAAEHAICQDTQHSVNESGFIPTRLIHVGAGDLRDIRLEAFASDRNLGDNVRYIALSYMWGGDQVGKTLKSNIDARTRSFSLADQPKSIRDAVKVTKELGFEYLWVDSLCIVQDDEDDKAQEIGKMHSVYQNAELTISAARSKGSKDGFLDLCRPLASVRFKYRGPDGTLGTVIANLKIYHISEPAEPIHGRGWTLQEHLLSKRLLIFGTFGLRWVCQGGSYLDGVQENASGTKTEISEQVSGRGNPAISMQWGDLVDAFTSRALTDYKDRLPAISAIAASYAAKRKPGPYLAGLWTDSLHDDLLWQVSDDEVDSSRDQHSGFPTWSWASMSRPIEYGDYTLHNRVTVVTLEFVSAHVVPMFTGAPFAQVKQGSLRVKGHLAPVQCRAVGLDATANLFEHTEYSPPLWRWAHSRCVHRVAIFDPVPSVTGMSISDIPPNSRPCAGAILDSIASAEDIGQCFCFEVYGLVPGHQQNYRIHDRLPRNEEMSESEESEYESGEDDTQLYSIGLVLKAVDQKNNVFQRIGLYLVEEPNNEESDHLPESPQRPYLEDWIRSCDKVTVDIV